MSEKDKKRMWGITWGLLAVSLAVLYVTHREIHFMMDDLWYSTMLSDERPITSLRDIVVSQIWHYHNWGGRSMAHGILQLTLLAGEKTADLLNVVMTLLLAGVICLIAGERRLPVFFAAIALPLGLNANWEMSMFWQSGAANYLYITVFVLGYVYCYLRELPEKGQTTVPKPLPGIGLWILPLGLLAGWSNENMGPAVWVLSLAVMGTARREKRKVRLWMILGSLACLCGSVMMIAAPGNYVRSAQAGEDRYGALWKLYLRSYSECRAAFAYLFPTLLLLLLVLALAKGTGVAMLARKERLLLFCALLSWGAMFFSPHYPDRAAMGTMVLLICAILSVSGRILRQQKALAWPLWWVVLLIWLRGMYFCCEKLGLLWGWIL